MNTSSEHRFIFFSPMMLHAREIGITSCDRFCPSYWGRWIMQMFPWNVWSNQTGHWKLTVLEIHCGARRWKFPRVHYVQVDCLCPLSGGGICFSQFEPSKRPESNRQCWDVRHKQVLEYEPHLDKCPYCRMGDLEDGSSATLRRLREEQGRGQEDTLLAIWTFYARRFLSA